MSRVQSLLAASAMVLSLAACGGTDSPPTREVTHTQVSWHWEPSELRRTYTIRTDSEWLSAWQANTPPSHPLTLRPQVNFADKMVLGVVQGSAGSGGYSLAISRVTELEDEIRVEYKILTPQAGIDHTFAVVALADFVIIERIDKPVLFIQTDA